MVVVNIPADGLFLAIMNKANKDGFDADPKRLIAAYLRRYLEAKPDLILLNVCYRRALTPSRVFDSYLYDVETDENGFALRDGKGETIRHPAPVTSAPSKYFSAFFTCARKLLEQGTDIYQTAIEVIHGAGGKVGLSVRMNDGHFPDNPEVNSFFATRDGGVNSINGDGAFLDYSKPAVQNHMMEYIGELLETYDADCIELDWLRFPTVLPEEMRGDLSVLRDYMKRIRGLIDRCRPHLPIAVRLLPDEKDNLEKGMDACGWIADGSADILTIENFYIPTNFEMPIREWRESIALQNVKKHPYRLLCGTDWGVSCMRGYNIAMTPALVRGFACACLCDGADGVYLFNFFEEDDDSSKELFLCTDGRAELKNCFSERLLAAAEPNALPRRYVHIGKTNRRYPVLLEANKSYTFSRSIPPFAGVCRLVVGCDVDATLSVSVEDDDAHILLVNERVHKGFEYISEAEIGKASEFIYAVSQVAPIVKTAMLPSAISDGKISRVTVTNGSDGKVKLLWLELVCEA